MRNDIEYLSLCSFAIHNSSLVKCLLKYLAHLFIFNIFIGV